MVYSMSKGITSKSSEQQDLESLLLKSSKLKPENVKCSWNQSHEPYIDSLKIEEGAPKSNTRNKIQGSFC